MAWTPTYLAWYVDGVQRHYVAGDTSPEPMWLLLGVHVGGEDWWGEPDTSTPFPTTATVDSVRIWTLDRAGAPRRDR